MFFKILVPLDGSSSSEAALKSASFMARAFQSEIKLVTVEDIPMPIYPGEVNSEMIDQLQKNADAYLQARAHELRQEGCCVKTVLLPPGSIAQRILDEVKKERTDLIMVGSHGRSGLSRVLLGSVAEHLARHAPCPVMITRLQPVEASA